MIAVIFIVGCLAVFTAESVPVPPPFCPVGIKPCARIKCKKGEKCVPFIRECAYMCRPKACPKPPIYCLVPACFGKPCPKGQICVDICPGGCIAACKISRCNRGCPKIYRPVCGTNRITYANQCILNIATCKSRGRIRKRHNGKCRRKCPDVCPLFYKPVCGSDGKTYSNFCFLGIASCKSGGKIRQVSDGPCPPK